MSKLIKDLSVFVFSLIEIALVFRFLLKLVGASMGSSFVTFIYENTQPLLSPFLLAFPTPSVSGKYMLEFTTLFAIFVYAFLSYLIQELLGFLQKKK